MKAGNRILVYISTLGPVGYIPFAPGTFGTAIALIFLFFLSPSPDFVLLYAFISFWIGVAGAYRAELHFRKKDPGHVIIDEFAGALVAMAFHEITVLNLILAFFFFRLFDILKPPPVRAFESRFPGGFGVMMDDIMAGVYANISVAICNYLIRTW